MLIQLTDPFLKGLKQTPQHIQKKIIEVIEECKIAQHVTDIQNRKPLKSKNNLTYFRIRISNYHVGIRVIEDVLHFQSIGLRGDFYKTYPPK